MKLSFLMFLALFSSATLAKGSDCEALCIVVDSQDSTLYYLDQLNVTAGASDKDTLRILKKQCQTLAKENGLYQGAMLVDALDFKSERIDDSEYSQSSSRSGSSWVSVGQTRARDRRGAIYGAYNIEVGVDVARSDSYSERTYRDRKLDVRLVPSTPASACVEDEDVADGNIPYTGSIIVR